MVLGKGTSRVGRRPSVRSSSAPVGAPGHGTSTSILAAVKRDVAADADAVSPRPAAPSLMSIVEDVSGSNRGWSEELKMKKWVGGSRTAKAKLLDGMVVRAPPPKATGMLEVKAPDSTFDRRHEMIAAIAAQSSKETLAPTSTTQK